MPDRCAQVQPQRARQPVTRDLRGDAEDLAVAQVAEDLGDAGEVESLLAGAEQTQDGAHRAAGDQSGREPRRLEQGERGEVNVAGAAAPAADQDEVALADLALEP